MRKFDSNTQPQAIIVGNHSDKFVRHTTNVLDEHEVEFVLCKDIYSAVGWLTRNNYDGEVFVIGRLEQLSSEQGKFFQKANEKGVSCCCFADANSARRYKHILAATKTGVFIINEPAEVQGVISKLLANNSGSSPEGKVDNKSSRFMRNEFLTTKAELDALFGV